MKTVETNGKNSQLMEAKFTEDINRIMELQYEICEIREKLNTAIQEAAKQAFPKGDVVSLEYLVALKEISKVLSVKEAENEHLVLELYQSVFPNDIFISQNYFSTWIKVGTDTIIKFSDDLSSIEVNVLSELN